MNLIIKFKVNSWTYDTAEELENRDVSYLQRTAFPKKKGDAGLARYDVQLPVPRIKQIRGYGSQRSELKSH